MAMPLGGRPLVMAKRMPASRRLCTAAWARLVSTFSSVTSVPSTSASTREIFRLSAIGTSVVLAYSSGRQARPSRASNSSAAAGPSLPAA